MQSGQIFFGYLLDRLIFIGSPGIASSGLRSPGAGRLTGEETAIVRLGLHNYAVGQIVVGYLVFDRIFRGVNRVAPGHSKLSGFGGGKTTSDQQKKQQLFVLRTIADGVRVL